MTASTQPQQPTSPAWQRGFARPSDADRFWNLLVDNVPLVLGPVAHSDLDEGTFTLDTGFMIHVGNPARDILDVPAEHWPEYLDWWLRNLRQNQPAALEKLMRNWARVRGSLRLRLLPSIFPDNMIATPLTSALSWGLAIDIPGGSTPVPADGPDRWNTDVDTLWAVARRNTRLRIEVTRTDVIAMERHLRLIEGNLFATGVLDDLSQVVPEIGSNGALAVAPTSNSLLVQPVDGWDGVADDAARLLVAALQFQDLSSHPLPPALLWYRGPRRLIGAAEFSNGVPGRPFAMKVLAPEPLRSALQLDPDLDFVA